MGPDAVETNRLLASRWVSEVTMRATPSLVMNSMRRRWKAMARGELGGARAAGAVDGRVVGPEVGRAPAFANLPRRHSEGTVAGVSNSCGEPCCALARADMRASP